MPNLPTINDFLSRKRIAVVGVSRNPKHFGRSVYGDLLKRGYDPIPVNPHPTKIEGRPAHSRIQEINPPPEAALITVSADRLEAALHDCGEAGVKRVWWLRSPRDAKARLVAVRLCQDLGMSFVDGLCPYLFLDNTGFPHNFHRWLMKQFGGWPK